MMHVVTDGEMRDLYTQATSQGQPLIYPKILYPRVLYRMAQLDVEGIYQCRLETYMPIRTEEGFLYYQHHIDNRVFPIEQPFEHNRDRWFREVSNRYREFILLSRPVSIPNILRLQTPSGGISSMGINDDIYHQLSNVGYTELADQICSSDNPRVRDIMEGRQERRDMEPLVEMARERAREALRQNVTEMTDIRDNSEPEEIDNSLDAEARQLLEGLD